MTTGASLFAPCASEIPSVMVGRDSVLQGFARRLESVSAGGPGRHYVLVGPRGNGKTVLCAVMGRMARERGMGVVGLNPGTIGEAGGLKDALVKPGLSERLGLKGVGAKVLGQVGVDVRLGERRRGGLADVLRTLALAHGLLLTIDEAHVLTAEDGFALLNAAQQVGRTDRLLVVLAGTPELERRLAAWNATFHERFQFVRVGTLQDADVRRGLVEPLAGKTPPTAFADDALDEIVADCAGFPFFLQEWGAAIDQSGAERVGAEEVERIGEVVLGARDQYYGRRWDEMRRAGIVGAAEALVRGGIADGSLSMRAVDDLLAAYVGHLGHGADAAHYARTALVDIGFIWDERGDRLEYKAPMPSLATFVLDRADAYGEALAAQEFVRGYAAWQARE